MTDVKVLTPLIGAVLTNIEVLGENTLVRLHSANGSVFRMYHDRDCCECVSLHDVAGDLADLVGSPIVEAEAVSQEDENPEHGDHGTWTFYKFTTAKGTVTMRWLGTSNGYYSEDVTFEQERADG